MIAIDGYLIDAAETEGHTFASDVTEDETESGITFTDNIKDKAVEISIQGVVSNTPIGDMVDVRARATASGIDSELPFLPSDEAQSKLLAIRTARKPITIETSRGTFENMALTNLDIPVSSETGFALSFTASFRQIRIVTNNRVTIRVAAPQLNGKGKITKVPTRNLMILRAGEIRLTNGSFGIWNPDKGIYEHRDGSPVDPREIVIPEGAVQFPATGEWVNQDGTPFTESQYTNARRPRDEAGDLQPFVDPGMAAIALPGF